MKKALIIPIFLFFIQTNFGQNKIPCDSLKKSNDSLTFNLFKAPSSAAFNLMGLENVDIEKPTDVTDFAVILNNATSGFTAIPKNFAMQFAPISLLKKCRYSFSQITGNNPVDNFNQSLTFSVGYSKNDTAKKKNDQLGIGVKFSLFRGNLSKEFREELFFRRATSDEFLTEISNEIKKDSALKESLLKQLKKLGLDEEHNKDKIAHIDSLLIEVIDKIEKKTKNIKAKIDSLDKSRNNIGKSRKNFKKLSELALKRYGWKLDINAGMVYDFLNEKFDSSKVSRIGVWLNGGYESESDFSVLGVARYLNQYDFKESKNIPSVDFGLRIVQSGLIDDKLSVSLEHIWRSQIDAEKGKAKNSVRYVFNVEYQLAKNQLLTLSLGKNFDGTNIKDGNLIAALNFIAGFGAKR